MQPYLFYCDNPLFHLSLTSCQVCGVMRQRGWRVSHLEEFYPRSPSLLGRNVGAGYKIQIRLREPSTVDRFLDGSDLVGTLLHEYVAFVGRRSPAAGFMYGGGQRGLCRGYLY